jgi:hypothetical protein
MHSTQESNSMNLQSDSMNLQSDSMNLQVQYTCLEYGTNTEKHTLAIIRHSVNLLAHKN